MPVSASLWAIDAALRVASLNLCTDEYLLLLAKPQEIASVSRLAKDPNESPLWRQAAPYAANRGTVESLIATRPTLLLTMGGGGKSTATLARRMGMKIVDLPFPATIADVEANMVRVAAAFGDTGRASAWRRRLHAMKTPPPRDTIFLAGGGLSVTKNTLADQWMKLGGFDQRETPGGRATLETLAVRPPAILLRSNYRAGQRSQGQAWLAHPLANPTRSKIIETDGRVWTCAGPMMLNEIQRLQSAQ